MLLKMFIHILFRPVYQHNLQIMMQEMLGYNTKKKLFLYCAEVIEILVDIDEC
jgi:hypothetical protein